MLPWLHAIPYPDIDPVFLKLGPLQFRWYGLMYLIGLTLAYFIIEARARAQKLPLNKDQVYDMIVYAAVGVFAGGRLGYVLFYNLSYYLENPLKIFAVWEGGMSFHGGLIGVMLATWLFGRRNGKSFFQLMDFIAPLVPIGLVNRHPRLFHSRAAAATFERIGRAADQGAGLIVLPELATTGYVFQTREEAFAHAEAVPDGATVELLSRLAAERDLYLVACIVERDGDRLYDTAVLVGPTGYVGRYRKTHLWNTEKLWFTPGDEGYKVFDTPIGRIGLLVCWDIWFPETARIVAQMGADIICIPTGWVWTPPPLYDASGVCMAAHLTITAAHVNNVFIATADRIGEERGAGFMGNSLIASTNGWPIDRIAGPDEDTIIYADVDLTATRTAPIWNQLNDLHRDRRTDLYDQMLGYRGATALPR